MTKRRDRSAPTTRKGPRPAAHLIPLEPRMMFDGAAVDTAADTAQHAQLVDKVLLQEAAKLSSLPANVERIQTREDLAYSYDHQSKDRGLIAKDRGLIARAWLESRAQANFIESQEPSPQTSFIFIDTNVGNYEALVQDWQGKGTIVLIDGARDGIDQIKSALAGQSNIAAIHIVSHGGEGSFSLGTTRITADSVAGELAASFASIGAKLSAGGDILIYGCDVGAGEAGQRLVNALAAVTGADVAASIDDTGSVIRGGDWTLENRVGLIEETSLVARNWDGLLAPALISVSSTTTILRVYNSAGTLVSDSGTGVGWAGGRSIGVSAGGYAVWSNAGTVGGLPIDLRAVIVSSTSGTSAADVINFDRPNTTSNDPAFLLTAAAGTGTASIQVRWEMVRAGTTTPIAADISYTIADLDGTGANPSLPTRESVVVSTDTLSSFQSAATSDIRFITNVAGQVTAYGTQNELAAPPLPISAARFNWLNTSNWTITYNTVRSAALTAGFNHDGNNEFNFGTGGVTTSIPRVDLDANDSSAAGSSYLATFVENAAALKIVDSDVTLTNPIGTIQSTTVTFTNPQAGDQLFVNGSTAASGTLAGGISYTLSATGVQLTGAATSAAYQAALQTITFRNTTERPATVDRTFTIGFSNGTFSSNNAVSTIKVIEVNDAPTAVNDGPLSTPEDTAINSINVLANDRDGEAVAPTTGDPLIVTVATAVNGTVVINPDGTLNYTPNLNFNGTDTITYTISDGRGGTSTATVPITITAVNDAPTPVGMLPPLANLDGTAGINVSTAGAFADVDGPTATYAATGLPAGLSINASTGQITGTINRSASQAGGGVYAVVVTRSDGSLSATQTFTWTITNPAPVAVNDTPLVVNEDTTGTTINVLANDRDPDGDPLSIVSASAVNGTVVVNADGTLRYTPNANFNGADTITYTISDGQGGTSTAQVPVTVNAVNDAPTPLGTLPPQVHADATAGISVATAGAFADIDGPTATYSATGLPAGLSINATTGLITGTIDRSASQPGGGVYAVVVTRSDGSLSATQNFTWTVTNPGPTATNDTASTSEDVAIASINVLINDADPDGDPLRVVSASASNGTVAINPDGTLRYTPNANFNGTDTITYTISDNQGGTSTATVTVMVSAVNDAPTPLGTLPPQSNVDAAAGINVPTASGFTDVDNTTLTYSATGLPTGLTINSATGVITGTIDRSASQSGGGVYSVVVTGRDAGGLTATQSFSWTVTNPGPIAVDDTATTNEDTSVLIPVLPNDSDPDGDPLAVVSAVASLGVATIEAGQVRYTPPANFNGTATITYTISDGQGGTSTATITVTVNPLNDAPVAAPIAPRNTQDGAVISIPVAPSFSDPDGDPLSFTAIDLPPGLTIDPVTGVISGTIDKAASQVGGGVYTATITASDGKGGTITQTIVFNVTNPAPIAANDTASTPEDTPVTISPLGNDSDPDGDTLTITSASALNGTVVINPDGTVTYTPNAGFNGSDTITYEISDGNGGTSIATIAVAVADVNDLPTLSGTIGNQTNLDGQLISLPVAGAFADPDGDTLTYVATDLPAGLTLDPATGVISGTIDNSASQIGGGIYSITVTASDGRGGSVSTAFSWSITNPAPTAANDSVTTDEDTAVKIPVLANDVDPDGDTLTITAASAGNGTVLINPDGSLQYTPNANFNGTDTIIYTISDGEGGLSTATVTVTVTPVNDGPTTVGLPNQNGDDGATVSFSVASAFDDVDGDVLTFSATGLPPNLVIDPATGLISGTLAPETSTGGPYVVTVSATDPSGATVTTSFVYSIQNVPPVAVADFASTPEDTPITVAVLANDTDPDGDRLSITSASSTHGTVTINADGSLTFRPDPDFNGEAVVTYQVSDGEGGFATATLTVTVGAVNDGPQSVPIPNVVNEDNQSVSVNVGDFFSDKDGDTLSFSAAGLPAGLGIDPATGIISGTIDRNASQPAGGVYSVTITAADPGGLTTNRTFTWTVTNPAPTANNDTVTTAEDTPATITVLANDTDPDGDPLTVTSATALNGTVTVNADGSITYLPNANFNGEDTLTYVISDGNGGTSTAVVKVTVTPINDAPVATDDFATTNEDTPVTIGVLGNDSDVDGDPLTVTAATSPDGTVVINPDGTITFTPNPNFNGPATITYTISDGKGGASTATVTVQVDAVNDAPVANPSVATTNEDAPVIIPVLANDTDADGDPLTVTAASAPNGTLVINPDGTVAYTPNPNFNGTDTITYTISDGKGGFSTSTVTVTVVAQNDAPNATPIAPQNDDDADVINLPVGGNFADLDGNTLSFTATGLPSGLSISATGVISGTIAPNASQGGPAGDGIYTVEVTASDGNGGAVTQRFAWIVGNPAPIAANDTAATREDTPVTVSVLTNDRDPDGDALTIISASAPKGVVTINPDGTITYAPNANFNGTDTITYTISDGQGGTSTAIVTVTVAAVNDAPVLDTPISAQSGVDNTAVSIPLAGNFSDLDGDALSFAIDPLNPLPPGLMISADGVITGTLDKAASQGGPNGDGIYTVKVLVSDGRGGQVEANFTYTVTNPAPTAANDTATTNEDTPVTIRPLTNDRDPDGDPLTITNATSPDGIVVINPDGTITFTPASNFNGPTTITYTISDGNGGTATATVEVAVAPINDAPTVDNPLANQANPDGDTVSVSIATNFSDLDANTLAFAATGLPAGLSIDPATGIISGTIDKAASQLGGGIYTVSITVSDGNGGTVTTAFTWTVSNPAPTAANDTATTNEDAPVIIPVLTNDSDPDADLLSVTSAVAENGTVTINADGTITYTPNANFNGTDTITYTISDGNGGTATATVDVTINPVNDAPTADPPLVNQTNVDSDIVNVDVAGSFADLDGDTLDFSATGLPAGLSISAAGVISGTIDREASQPAGGVYTVVVTASDGNGGIITSTFIWNVTNPAPNAMDDTASTAEDTPVNIAVLTNDNDPDGDPLTVTSAVAAHGTVTILPDGTIDYVPDANFNGTDTIVYTISDGNGGTSTASVTVSVSAVNDNPETLGLPDLTNSENQIIVLPLGPAFSDPEGNTLTFSATGLPAGLAIDPATGRVVGAISDTAAEGGPGADGVYVVTITVVDGVGGTVSTSFTWTIDALLPLAVDDGPVATDEDTPITVDVLANDTDPNPATPKQVLRVSATDGAAVINPDGTITFTPNPDFNGTATVFYTMTDGTGRESSATATIIVTEVNDAPDATPLPNRADLDGDTITIPAGALFSDREGNTLSFSADGLPAGLSIDPVTGVISGAIDKNASQIGGGVYTVTVTADDGNGGVSTSSFVYTVTNPGPTAADDMALTIEDNSVDISVLANDVDPDNDTLTVTTASAPNGTVAIGPGGVLTYTPDPDFNGTDTITYTISDSQGGTSTAIVTVTVGPGNDAPVALALPARNNLDSTDLTGPMAIDVSGAFSDVDGDILTFTAAGLPAGLSMAADGKISGAIAANASAGGPGADGIYTVSVTASDGNGGTVVQTFTWSVTNPPPLAADNVATTTEDTAVAIPVLVNDSDPDGDPLVVTAASAGNGKVTIGAGGVLTYTPDKDFNGTDTISYTISDGNGGAATATVTVTVTPANDAPVAEPISPRTNVDSAVVFVPVAANFSDIDGGPLSYSAAGLPAGLTIDAATGVISGTIDKAASQVGGGVYSVMVTANDGRGGSVDVTFTWTITNPPPIAASDAASTSEDMLVNIPVLTNDNDTDGDTLAVVTASAGNGSVVIKPDGTLDYTPDPNFNGTDTLTYTISDGNGGTSTTTVTITVSPVNDPPVAIDDIVTTGEDTPVTVSVLGNDSDLDGDLLTVTTATAANGTVVINPDGTVTYTPNGNFNGTDTITYTISDGKGGTSTASVTVVVAPANDPPVAINDTGTTAEDAPVTINVLANDSDVDGDPLTVVTASSPDGTVKINPDGSITFVPDANFNGPTTVTYTISDGNGGFSTATITLTVAPVNDPPVAVNDNASTAEDTPVTIAVVGNDSDVDGDPLTVTAASAGNGSVLINPDGTITYTPNPDFNGVDLITYTISDGKGGFSTATVIVGVGIENDAPVSMPIAPQANLDAAGVTLSIAGNFSDVDGDVLSFSATGLPPGLSIDPATGLISGTLDKAASQTNGGDYTVTVTAADGKGGAASRTFSWTVSNPAPVATNDTASTNEDRPVTIAVLVNDTDPDGDPLAISTASAPNGTVAINPDGTITYTPDANFNGTDTITYTINDGNGGTSTATITVTVAPVNDAPVATNDNASTAEDTPVTVAVLPNDSDVDGDPLTVVGAIAANGTVVINPDGTITYTPNPDFNGVDTVTYTISDGKGGTSTATVTIGVGLVNDAPTSTPIAPQANPDSAIVSLPLAANFADRDGDPLTFSATGLPAGLSINPTTGLISGTIAPSASQPSGGIYSVTITAADGKGGATSQTFTWTVTNPAPNATNDTASTTEDAPVTVAVLANDSDPDGDPLTITAATSPNGTVVINPDGTLTFTPTANFNGPATISYTISDGNGGTATAIVTISVAPVNDAPIARSDSAATNEDTPVTIPVLPNDSDVDGDPLILTTASAANGTVTINPDGTLRYTPNPNFNGTDTITYTISDGKGGTATTTVAVTVNPVNDVPVAANDTATNPEDAPVSIPVLANDTDADGDPLTVTAATSPNGTVVINPDGTITFTPNPNFNGPAVVTYTVSDGKGGTTTATATITVTPVNDAPVANPSTAVTNEDTPVRVLVLANDSDVDGNPLPVVAASAPNGTVTINPDGTVTYTPNANFNGTDTITYQISDGQGGFATSTVTVTVAPVNDPPVAANAVFTMDEDATARIPVLANDVDLDGDPLTITAASSPNGTVTINPDGTISFTPTRDFFGPATITYTVSDGKGGTSTATVTVNVRNVNELPVDGDEAISTIGGVINTIPVLANAIDPDRDPLSVFAASADVGTVTINPDGTLSYVAPPEFQGVATIVYIVSDGKGGFDLSIVTVNVQQASADMNALLGGPPAGIPDGWRVDQVRDQSEEFIEVPLIIDQTANDFRSLRPTPMLFGDRPLLTAINGISWLRGTTDLTETNTPISDVVSDLDRIRDIRFGADRLFDPRFGDFIVKSLTGFSVRQLNTGNEQVMIESVIRGRVIYMEVRDIGKDSDPRVVEYQLRMRDGGALPDWIRMDSRGLAIIERPVDADTIRLIVRAIRADGKVIIIPVIVQGATGEIQIDQPSGDKLSTAEPLSKTMQLAASSAADEAARLAQAFKGEG